MRPGPSADKSEVLLSEEKGIYLGVDDVYRLSVFTNGFRISQVAAQDLDVGILTRIHVQNYSVIGDRVTRIPPIAVAPQDFLDEWIDLPWQEAARWSSAENLPELQDWHSRLQRTKERWYYSELHFVQLCEKTSRETKWQIGLSIDSLESKKKPADLPDEVFFTIVGKGDDFILQFASANRPSGCPGKASPVNPRDLGKNRRLP